MIHSTDADKDNPEKQVVAIYVGPEKLPGNEEPFLISRDLAIDSSPVFRAAFAESYWLESEQNSMVLDDIEPETFARFNHWVHNRQRQLPKLTGDVSVDLVADGKLWMLADRLCISKLQNLVCARLMSMLDTADLKYLEAFMHLTYGEEDPAPQWNTSVPAKILLGKVYFSRKEEIDACGYELLPGLKQELVNYGEYTVRPRPWDTYKVDLRGKGLRALYWRSMKEMGVLVDESARPHRYNFGAKRLPPRPGGPDWYYQYRVEFAAYAPACFSFPNYCSELSNIRFPIGSVLNELR